MVILRELCCLLLLALCLAPPTGGSAVRHHRRQKRYIGQFGDMIRFATQREALLYNNYGNHCGTQGGDQPVLDEVDRCCWNHDRCYIEAQRGPCASSWLGPALVRYSWSWDGQHLQCGEDDECRMASCQCDVSAAQCFTRHPWNPELKRYSIWDILA
ncbi:basic phospholipase A2 acanthin-2-like [Panulirus ornatus]|uniref:basic phospholipase A2 acanthin-2-like n=1 Tax=Panulirus ornatus TaxID=150431 RepID=UPI003A896E1B